MNTAIAQHLNVAESAIIRVEEWANVLFAVVKGIGARFVSKKVIKVEFNQSEAAELVAEKVSNKYGFGQCKVWSNRPGELRVYVGKHGYVEIKDTVDLYYLKGYKKEVAELLGDLVGAKVKSTQTLTTAGAQKCWRDEDGNPVDEIANPAEAVYFG
jgi:hypothetical protein